MQMQGHHVMVLNILRTYKGASAEALDSGKNWYSDAHYIASAFAAESGYSLEQCAAVIAITSPKKRWGANVRIAGRIIESRGTLTSGTFQEHLRKANDVLNVADNGTPMPQRVAKGAKAEKTRAFYLGIVTNGNTNAVCIDRHAYCIAVNSRKDTDNFAPNLSQYRALAGAYRAAAAILGVPAITVQAVTWVAWREIHGIVD